MADLFEYAAGRRRPQSNLERDFEEFHRAKPGVYRLFDRFTREVIVAGFRRYSADAIMHRVRWHTHIETGDVEFKLNNNYVAYYARLWMRDNPRYAGFFETRRVKGDEEAA